MIPPLIVKAAVEAGLDLIAVADHNSAENVRAVMKAAQGTPLKVLPGMECESVEGVHILCIFDSAEDAESMQELVFDALPDLPNMPERLGAQMVVTADAEFVRYNERLLIAPTELTLEEIARHVEMRSGLAIPAHVDRTGYGLYGVLGFLPEESDFLAVEISKKLTQEAARFRYSDLNDKAIIRSSDAHTLDEIGSVRTSFYIEHRSVSEIRLAFQHKDGRRIEER